MSKVRVALSVLGTLLVLGAVIFSLRPETATVSFLSNLDTTVLTLVTAGVMILFILYGFKSFRLSNLEEESIFLQAGAELEKAEDSDEHLKIQFEMDDEEEAREQMRETVKHVLIQQHGFNEEEAEEIIGKGSWTDDSVAAAIIDTGLNYPLLERLREWLEEDETLDRRIRRAVKSVEKLHEEERE